MHFLGCRSCKTASAGIRGRSLLSGFRSPCLLIIILVRTIMLVLAALVYERVILIVIMPGTVLVESNHPRKVMDIRADGDAHLDVSSFDGFVVPPCKDCGGVWKPRVVFFGGSLNSAVKLQAQNALLGAQALLVMGTSAKVFSAFSLVKLAAQAGKPVAVVNIGETRADPLISPALRMHLRCSEALLALCRHLGLQV